MRPWLWSPCSVQKRSLLPILWLLPSFCLLCHIAFPELSWWCWESDINVLFKDVQSPLFTKELFPSVINHCPMVVNPNSEPNWNHLGNRLLTVHTHAPTLSPTNTHTCTHVCVHKYVLMEKFSWVGITLNVGGMFPRTGVLTEYRNESKLSKAFSLLLECRRSDQHSGAPAACLSLDALYSFLTWETE